MSYFEVEYHSEPRRWLLGVGITALVDKIWRLTPPPCILTMTRDFATRAVNLWH